MDERHAESVRKEQVLNSQLAPHKAALIRHRPDVVGGGLGRENGEYVLRVFVSDAQKVTMDRIKTILQGLPMVLILDDREIPLEVFIEDVGLVQPEEDAVAPTLSVTH